MKQVVFRLCLAPLVILWLTACVSTPVDQSQSVVVERRNGDITVLRNSDIEVVEKWEVRFVSGSFHKAFRTIPLKQGSSITGWQISEGDRFYRQSDSGQAHTFDVVQRGDEASITWYFPHTANATRTFNLQYTIRGALRIYPDGDQLYLTFIEADRSYPITSSRVIVHLPETFAADQIKLATYQNRRESYGTRIIDGQTVMFSGGPFAPGAAWEIRAQFPHGVVTANAPAWQLIEDQQPVYNLIALFGAVMIVLVGGSGLYLLWDFFGRDHPGGIIAQHYTAPPDATPPGMVGLLIDERADLRDIVATLIDLARRGYLRISELSGMGPLAVRDIVFTRTGQNETDLRHYERQLLDTVFGSRTQRYVSDLRNTFHTAIPALQRNLYEEAVRSGYFAQNPQSTRYKFTAGGAAVLVLVILAGIFGYPLVSPYAPLAIWDFVAAAGVALGLVVIGPIMPKKTLKGATTVAKWRAFKRYLEHIDRYTKIADVKDTFEHYLPYAIAFGFERAFVQHFAAVDTPAPDWYQPYPMFIGPDGHHRAYHDTTGGMAPGSSAAVGSGIALPTLDGMAQNIGAGLNTMSSGFFSMLDVTAEALTSRISPLDAGNDGKDGLFNWIGSDSGGSGGGWSGGGSGGSFGGGSSGFG